MRPFKVGEIDNTVISLFNLSTAPNTPILIGDQNIQHIKDTHPEAFEKYGEKIQEILQEPDYVAKHPKKDSLEYIKNYYDNDEKEYVMVAVRATKSGVYFARTLFVMNDEKVMKYYEKNAFYRYNKEP